MGFFKNNQVLLVMIPLIIGSHFGWSALQNDKRFVAEHEKKGQPVFIVSTLNDLFKINDVGELQHGIS